jgi:hypothetical protein
MRRKPLQPPVKLTYSGKNHYYKSSFVEDYTLEEENIKRLSFESHDKPPQMYKPEARQQKVSEIIEYAHINMVNSEE